MPSLFFRSCVSPGLLHHHTTSNSARLRLAAFSFQCTSRSSGPERQQDQRDRNRDRDRVKWCVIPRWWRGVMRPSALLGSGIAVRTVLCVFGTCEGVESEDVAADDFRYRRI